VHHKRATHRRALAEIVDRLYKLRSAIVHTGLWDERPTRTSKPSSASWKTR
jgi:hypothetical protein